MVNVEYIFLQNRFIIITYHAGRHRGCIYTNNYGRLMENRRDDVGGSGTLPTNVHPQTSQLKIISRKTGLIVIRSVNLHK
jgi:hypothetical protein